MLLIPFDPTLSADQPFQVLLSDALVVRLRFNYNTRSGFWFLTISNTSGATLQSIKLVPNWPLMREFDGTDPVPGEFFVFPLDDSAVQPIGYNELGRTWGLFWATEAEAAQWSEAYGL